MNNPFYQPMLCPVCGDFYFSELQEDDEDISHFQCSRCGWRYDYNQTINPDLKPGANEQSLNEYRAWYKKVIAENPEYDYFEEHCPPPEPHLCPVCGEYMFKDRASFDFCPVCKWCDDGVMETAPDEWAGCGNDLCLNDYRERYRREKGL